MAHVAALPPPVVIDTDASSSFVCDYVAGINRVISLPPYLLVDNIGRNFEIWRFEAGEQEPSARSLYELTSYPGDPIASLLDLDIHAAFLRHEGRELVAVNHYGCARGFELPSAGTRMRPTWERQLLGDAERVVMAGECFITSSPRGEFTDDPAQPGIVLFESIGPSMAAARLAHEQSLADWGVVSALAASESGHRLAVAAGQRLGVFALHSSGAGIRLGDCLWEARLDFDCQWLHVDSTQRLWTGGDAGINTFALDGGARHFSALPPQAAWGYGSDPIVLSADCREIYVLGHDASLHVIDVETGASHQLYQAADDIAASSLGIGHAALRDGSVYAGFSRGGFRLFRYDVSAWHVSLGRLS